MDYTLPNGKTIGGIPDGTAELEIVRNAIKKGWASPDDFGFLPEEWTPNNTPDAGINPIAGNFQALGQGVTFGNADELQAAVGAATTTEDASGKGILDRYRAIRDQIRAERQQFINQEGAIAYAPEVIGGLMTGGSGLARTVPSGWRGMMATGAVEGGIAGAGFAPGDIIEDPTPTILGTSAGAAAGGVGGLAGYGVGNIAGRMGGMTVEKLKQQFPNTRGVPEQAARQSAEGDGLSDDMARYVINKGKATKDPLYSAAKTQGVSDGTINAIKELSPVDKNKGKIMLQLIRKAKGNENFPHRPGDIAGKTLLDKIDFVADINKKSRIQLKKYATTKLAGQPITLDDVFQSFASGLDDLGVEIIEKKGGKIAVDFSGARLGSKDNKPIKEVVNYMVARMNKGKLDAREAHWLKQKIDNNIPWDATNKMSSQGENLLKSFRRDINEQLRASFDGYKALNEVVGETTDALKEVRKATGIKVDIESPYASAALGQESRKLMTNYKSRSVLESSIDKIEAAASKHGLDTQESVKAQARFVTQLEDLFGESAKGGFRAETRKATRDALRDAATGNRAGTIGRAIDSTLDAATGVSQKAQFEVIEKLLAR